MVKLLPLLALFIVVQFSCAAPPFAKPRSAIDLSGCGKTKGCYISPAGCQADACDIIYTHRVAPGHRNAVGMVNIELSAKSAGWVAVGYNRKRRMNGTDVLACQLTPDNQKVVVKNLHNVNHSNALDQPGQASPFISNAEGDFTDGRITCSFQRPVTTSDPVHDMNLSRRHFLIFAVSSNGTAAADEPLMHPHTMHPHITYGVYSAMDNFYLNSSVIPVDLSTCGTAKGCSRHPPGCSPPSECEYVYTQQLLPGGIIAFELAAALHGWVAVGFNDIRGMNNTDVLACQAAPTAGVFIKNLHNVNTSNYLDDPDLVDPYIVDPIGWLVNNHIVCKFSRTFVTASPQFDLDLSKPHYLIFTGNSNATAPSNTALDHKHNYEPIITPDKHAATETFNINGTALHNDVGRHKEHRGHTHWQH